ncbi:hypothetical protein IW147_006147, partial [Coemansia sp. RSA 720]
MPNHMPLVVAELDQLREHIYDDFHIGSRSNEAHNVMVIVDSVSSFLGTTLVANKTAVTLNSTLETEWFNIYSWIHHLLQIVAAYTLVLSEMLGNTPAVVFFGPQAMSSDRADAVHQPGRETPTAAQLEQSIQAQVDSHRTMVCTRANARENCSVRTRWFVPGEEVTIRPHPVAPNLVDQFSQHREPYRVVAHHNTLYALAYADRTPFACTVQGQDLIVYHFAEGADPIAQSLMPEDDVEIDSGSSWHPRRTDTPGTSTADRPS